MIAQRHAINLQCAIPIVEKSRVETSTTARFDDGGNDHFEKSRSDGIQTGRNDESRHGRQKLRQKSETAKPDGAQSFSGYRAYPIADFVHEFTR